MPETPIKPGALFAALMEMPRPFSIVEIPRKDPIGEPVGFVRMQVLTQSERMAAMADAEKVVRDLMKEDLPKSGELSHGYVDMRSNELSLQILLRACRDVDQPEKRFFPSALEARKALTGDELGVLFSSYLIVQAERGPIVSQMTESEMEGWIVRLVEGASRDPLALLSLEAHQDLTMLLACRLYKSVIGTGSSGEPASDTAPTIDKDD